MPRISMAGKVLGVRSPRITRLNETNVGWIVDANEIGHAYNYHGDDEIPHTRWHIWFLLCLPRLSGCYRGICGGATRSGLLAYSLFLFFFSLTIRITHGFIRR
jgi:hypothetical protein